MSSLNLANVYSCTSGFCINCGANCKVCSICGIKLWLRFNVIGVHRFAYKKHLIASSVHVRELVLDLTLLIYMSKT